MRIGFVSTRLAGTDGVSLETAKIAHICRQLGHEVFACAGELEGWGSSGMLVPEMHFNHAETQWIQAQCFGPQPPSSDLRPRIAAMSELLQARLADFVQRYAIDVLFVQNALAIPMHIPLGLAITGYVRESGLPCLAHHHDFYWERTRFEPNHVPDLLAAAFPPDLPGMHHIVINSLAQRSLRERLGLQATILPNVFDFASAAPGISDENADLRRALGLDDNTLFILQPTRVVPRKGIEQAIALVQALNQPRWRRQLLDREAVLVISHHAGDEGLAYLQRLQEQTAAAGVRLLYAADQFATVGKRLPDRKVYALWDAYVHADFVTYPSLVEGFGNALLETIYFRLPALVNRYSVYEADIAPLGFDLIEIKDGLSEEAVAAVVQVLRDPIRRRRMVERNYELARRHFSYETASLILARLFDNVRSA